MLIVHIPAVLLLKLYSPHLPFLAFVCASEEVRHNQCAGKRNRSLSEEFANETSVAMRVAYVDASKWPLVWWVQLLNNVHGHHCSRERWAAV